MKKVFSLTLALIIFSFASFAQSGLKNRTVNRCGTNRISPIEKKALHRDAVRIRTAKRVAGRDGIITPIEQLRIKSLKREMRRDAFRYSTNRRSRF
jgi:hypothetical protein